MTLPIAFLPCLRSVADLGDDVRIMEDQLDELGRRDVSFSDGLKKLRQQKFEE